MKPDADIQNKPALKIEDGLGFEGGSRVRVTGPVYPDDEPDGNGPPVLSIEQIYSLVITGADDSSDRDFRFLWLGMKMGLQCAPKNVKELAIWLTYRELQLFTVRHSFPNVFKGFCAIFRHTGPFVMALNQNDESRRNHAAGTDKTQH